ncbi:MAG: hypothetical protein FJ333_10390, partial [Sphingomonadales bacterium]|nr:hypothetical protein [Sphingomonadales bacterium]
MGAFFALLYVETSKRGMFDESIVVNEELSEKLGLFNTFSANELFFDYFHNLGDVEKSFFEIPLKKNEIYDKIEANLNTFGCFESILLKKILNLTNVTFILQDENGNQFNFLLKIFLKFGICPDILKKGPVIFLLELKDKNIRFISSSSYISGSEFDLANQFNIQYEKLFDTNGKLTIDNFAHFNSKPKFDFRKEFLANVKQKMFLGILSMLKFLNEFLFLQINCHEKATACGFVKNLILLNPFNPPNCSLGGAVFKVFKLNFLNFYSIYSVQNENGKPGKCVSRIEHKYTSYLEHKFPEKKFITAFNNPQGQFFFKEAIPDAYSPIDGLCVFVLGCYYHCDIRPTCPYNKNVNTNKLHFTGQTYAEVNKQQAEKMVRLMENNSVIKRIDEIYECDIIKKSKNDDDFRSFLSTHYIKAPLTRIIPRNSYRGSYTDNYRLRWSQNENPSEKLYFCDINGLYSYVSMSQKFMVGPYEVLIGQCLENLKVENNHFYYNNRLVHGGVMLLSILPPKKLYYPFLIYRSKS